MASGGFYPRFTSHKNIFIIVLFEVNLLPPTIVISNFQIHTWPRGDLNLFAIHISKNNY